MCLKWPSCSASLLPVPELRWKSLPALATLCSFVPVPLQSCRRPAGRLIFPGALWGQVVPVRGYVVLLHSPPLWGRRLQERVLFALSTGAVAMGPRSRRSSAPRQPVARSPRQDLSVSQTHETHVLLFLPFQSLTLGPLFRTKAHLWHTYCKEIWLTDKIFFFRSIFYQIPHFSWLDWN